MRLIRGNVERITENEAVIEKLMADGFKDLDAEANGDPDGKGADVTKLTVPELKALAKEKGIEGASALTKEELLAVLKEVI